ncbi:hypothetical protein ABZP36_007084 [Zizania latifolia]
MSEARMPFQIWRCGCLPRAADDSMSGTTAVAALVAGSALHVANVGDKRAVAGVWRDGRAVAEELSWDQTPFRADELARVKAFGARVMSVEQVEGVRDLDAEGWVADEGDLPRVWARDGLYPGTAFTRSLGDLAVEAVGVIAEPEVKSVKITPAHLFFIVASDGVFEFLPSQEVIDMGSNKGKVHTLVVNAENAIVPIRILPILTVYIAIVKKILDKGNDYTKKETERLQCMLEKVSTLVVAEHEGGFINPSSLSTLAATGAIANENRVSLLLGGFRLELRKAAEHAASSHPLVSEVLITDSDAFAHPLAEPWAELLRSVQQKGGYSHVIASSISFEKNLLP